MTAKRPSYKPVDQNLSDSSQHRQQIATVLNSVLSGKQNNILDVTLTPNATSTTITDARLSPFSHLSFTPVTANALTAWKAGILPLPRSKGSAVLNHAASAATDQTFTVEITA